MKPSEIRYAKTSSISQGKRHEVALLKAGFNRVFQYTGVTRGQFLWMLDYTVSAKREMGNRGSGLHSLGLSAMWVMESGGLLSCTDGALGGCLASMLGRSVLFHARYR